ncbi:hypothetical protein ACIQ7J_02100 [Streptomyces fagopyri]|uniref:response regulator n=1 Tax=Streptomyces fagopyri TaxID=2662397 RepID=UPI0037F31F1A
MADDQFVNTIGVAIDTVIADCRTESLLGESQRPVVRLQDRSDEPHSKRAELQRSNAQLMDGHETISVVRRSPRWTRLPVVALTAKAMPGAREKSISRGANDHVPEPVDVDRPPTVVRALLDPEGAGPAAPDDSVPESVAPGPSTTGEAAAPPTTE